MRSVRDDRGRIAKVRCGWWRIRRIIDARCKELEGERTARNERIRPHCKKKDTAPARQRDGYWTSAVGWVIAIPAAVGALVGFCVFIVTIVAIVASPVLIIGWLQGWQVNMIERLVALVIGAAFWLGVIYSVISGPSRRARKLVFHSLCGACGYAIDGLPAAYDGLVECPECHAAWRLEPSCIKRCTNCDAALAGRVVGEDGRVSCTSCGTEYELHTRDFI